MAQVAVWRVSDDPDHPISHLELAPAPGSLDAASKLIPGGAYSTFRTFSGNRMMRFAAHVERLEETARLAGHPISLPAELLRTALRKAVNDYPAEEKRVRLTLDLEQEPGRIFISVEPLHIPSAADTQHGVKVVTRQAHRNNPKAKLTSFLATAGEIRQDLPSGINEAVMVDENGHVLEGLTSNFFAVMRGEIWTADEGVLSGLTRALVLEEAALAGVKVHLEGMLAKDLPQVEEAFLTSASRAVLPVTQIDGRTVGSGAPGPITLRLLERYQARIQEETETI